MADILRDTQVWIQKLPSEQLALIVGVSDAMQAEHLGRFQILRFKKEIKPTIFNKVGLSVHCIHPLVNFIDFECKACFKFVQQA